MDELNQEVAPESIEEIDGGNLPSARDDVENALDGFKITDELQAKYFKNGKVYGRFDNFTNLAEAFKSLEIKYSGVVKDIKEGRYQPVDVNAQQEESTPDVMEVAKPLVDKFVQNGMELTDEILEEAKAKGLDIRDVKLAAIDLREKINSAYNLVGGKDEYEAMIAWGKENFDDKQKIAFDKELSSGMGEWAIKGLYSEYKSNAGNSNQQPQDRFRGEATSNVGGIKPYASMTEILKDRHYLNSHSGSKDTKARELHNRRLDATPSHVIGR